MPAPPSSAQKASNARSMSSAAKQNDVGGSKGSGFGSNSRSGTSSSKSSGGASSKGPGASQAAAKDSAAKKANSAKASPKTSVGSKAKSPSAPKGPGASIAASKVNAAAKTPVSTNRGLNAAPTKMGVNSSQSGGYAPKSIQGMINDPVSFSGKNDSGLYGRFSNAPSWQNAPGANVMGSPASRNAQAPGGWMDMQRNANGTLSSSFVNAHHVPAVSWSGGFANKFQRDGLMNRPGENVYQAIEDTALRTNQPINVFSGARSGKILANGRVAKPGSPNHVPGYAIDNYLRDRVTGEPIGADKLRSINPSLERWASFPIGGVNARAGRPPAVAAQIDSVLKGPYQSWSNDVFDTVYQNPGMYGDIRDSLRYGGAFKTGSTAKDYMHHDVTPNTGKQVTQHAAAEARMRGNPQAPSQLGTTGLTQFASVSEPAQTNASVSPSIPRPSPNPRTPLHQAAGTYTTPYDRAEPPAVNPAAIRDMAAARAPGYPPSQNMSPPPGWQKAPVAAPPQAPRPSQNMQTPPGWTSPGIDSEPETPSGYFQQFAMTPEDMENLKKQARTDFSFGELMEMRKNQEMLPGFMGPITRDQNRPVVADRPPPPIPRMRPVDPVRFNDQGVRKNVAPFSAPPVSFNDQGVRKNVAPFSAPPVSFNDQGVRKNVAPFSAPKVSFNDQGVRKNVTAYAPSDNTNAEQGDTVESKKTITDRITPEPSWRRYANPKMPPGYAERYGLTKMKDLETGPYNPNKDKPELIQEPYDPNKYDGHKRKENNAEYSDNPIQGPSNPSQEPEDPRAVKERQSKYAQNGAMIGGIVAGPIGAVIGGLLGNQMAKTKPGQRQQIANNPAALNANVNSINRMMEERGVAGSNMRVTNRGFQQVLTNPEAVLNAPENYTTLEEMLAALAAGVDPSTGKPIA